MKFKKGDIVTEIDGQVLMCKYGSSCPPALSPPLVVCRKLKIAVGTARAGGDHGELLEITSWV